MNGRTVKALAQPTKSAFLFVLNRETGEPIWPIEERPVPQSDVPKEKTSPTQPLPHQTRAVRSAGCHRKRSHRPDARAQGRGARGRQALQDGADLHAARRQQPRRSARDAAAARRTSAAPTGPAARWIRRATISTSIRTPRSSSTGWCPAIRAQTDMAYVAARRAPPDRPARRRWAGRPAAADAGAAARRCRGCRSSSRPTTASPPTT